VTGSTPAPGPRGLLAIFAHPDDESFGVGGVLAQAAAAGIPTTLICATDGDLGGEEGNRDLGRDLRRGELRTAMTALGVGEPVFLGYGDSGMENWPRPAACLATADAEEVIGRLVECIHDLRPAVILTFDPGGIYGHPDHVTISARATEAYRRASAELGGPRVLYHQVVPRSAVTRMRDLQALLSNASPEPPAPPSEDDELQGRRFVEFARPDEDVTTLIDVRAELDRKLAALAAHESQMRSTPWADAPREMIEAFLGTESFVRVDPPPAPGERETRLLGLT
jgi:LmbE family N-acetylglucosaminyl deacetylase